jgi:subfamily B ATP-binding cassette protein HlyB/CyaB
VSVDQQLRHNDCGVSAIKTIFNLFDREIDRNYIQEQIFLDERGSSIKDIKVFFDKNGCVSKFKFLDVTALEADLSPLKNLFPFIIPVKKSNHLHYVVVNGLRGNKLKIYDPGRSRPYYLTFAELRNIAHYTNSYWELVDFQDKVEALCSAELSRYQVSLAGLLATQDPIHIFNKLVYFTHLRDDYGFKDENSEKAFLEDLLTNQEISLLPKQYRQIKYEEAKVKLSAPLVLSVKSVAEQAAKEAQPIDQQNVYHRLINELGKNKKLWYIYLFTALFAASITQLAVFINQILLDHVLPSFQINILTLFAIGFALFRLFSLLISQYKYFVSIHVGNILDKYFLSTFNDKLNTFSLKYTQTFRKGDLTERLSDSLKLKSFFLNIFSRIMVDTFVSIYSLTLLFYINWQLTLLVCTVMVLFYAWFKVITPMLQNNEKKRFVLKADFISKMIEKIDGNQVIKSFGLESIFSNKVLKSIRDLVDIQTKSKYIDLVNVGIISFVSTAAYTLIVIFLARQTILTQTLTFGQLITFIMLSERIFSTLSRILEENLSLQENEVILRRYFDFNETTTVSQVKNQGITDFIIESIVVKDLSFGYNPSEPILKGIDFYISRGEKIRIEGGNGSGKSSFSKILAFLYEHNSGDIIINGTKSNFFNHDRLKRKILLVSNEDILFNDTLEFNIAFGREVKHSRMIELAKEIEFYDFIAKHEEGLGFAINENGKNLSTGQRKKILIMRALLSEAEVIILDEVLSGIDLGSRQKIEALIESTNDRTFIIISHEPIRNLAFDRNIIMTNGLLTYV